MGQNVHGDSQPPVVPLKPCPGKWPGEPQRPSFCASMILLTYVTKAIPRTAVTSEKWPRTLRLYPINTDITSLNER